MSVADAATFITQLNSIACQVQHPQITPTSWSITTKGLGDTGLSDALIYDIEQYFDNKGNDKSGMHKFCVKEAGQVAKLKSLVKDGQQLLIRLYSYRSCSRAIAHVDAQNQPSKADIYRKIFEILRPEIDKMRDLMFFRDRAVQTVVDTLLTLTPDIRDREMFLSMDFLASFAEVLDMFVVLDAMKNIKGSMNNDFSMYKRAFSNLPKDIVEDETTINHKLYFFLGQHDQFSIELKKSLANVPGYDDVMQDVMVFCASSLENGNYLLHDKKHGYLKALAFGMYLIDGDGEEKDITRRKKLKLDRFGKLFKATPVVPLFGDMPIALANVYGKAPHLGSGKWDALADSNEEKATVAKSFNIIHHIDAIKSEFIDYLASYQRVMNVLRVSTQRNGWWSISDNASIYNLVLQGLKLLAFCTTKLLEQGAWKHANPTSRAVDPSIPEDAISYELAVRYNCSKEERKAMVECIVIVKNLARVLGSLDIKHHEAINAHMYAELQNFMQVNMADYIGHATKKKRAVASLIKQIRDIAADVSFEEKESSPTKSKLPTAAELKRRTNAFSASQLHYIRTLLDYAFNDKSKGMKGGLMREKDFKDNQVNEMQDFMDKSAFYPYMADLRGTVKRCSDISDLWHKEFYLELAKQVQFPISMSLPWILTETILESNDPEIMEFLFHPFDIYNDAAHRSLHDVKCRYIYDEIVAEVNLCFDQLIFNLSQKVFTHFKKVASNIVLASDLNGEVERLTGPQKEMPSTLFDAILQQKHFQLLGRSINITELITQFINQYLRKSIDIAISRYEGSDLTNIMELKTLIESARTTHKLLSRYLALDPFEDMLVEMDEAASCVALNGRILTHTVQEIIDNLVPNFCYNSVTERFIKSPVQTVEPSRPSFTKAPPMYLHGTKALFIAFSAHNGMFRNFVGKSHYEAIIALTGLKSLPVIIGEITKHVETLIEHTMSAYINVIQKGTPQTLKLPLFEYGTAGAFEYFAAHLRPLITYPALQTEVLQAFREVGNALLIVRGFEEAA
ncbi:Cytoplasmic FMR1-interacting protein 2, partial [Quaeritorhiza haematococci]